MNETKWEKLFKLWDQQYYFDFFVILCILTALYTAVKFKQRGKVYHFLFLYILSALFLFPVSDIILAFILNPIHETHIVFIETTNISFALTEYIVFCTFFNVVLKSKIIRVLMLSFLPLIVAALIVFILKSQSHTLSNSEMTRFADIVISVELLFLGFLCIVYYFELLTVPPSRNLLQSPSFWIVSGLFFYCFMIAPFFLVSERFVSSLTHSYYIFYSVHYISFGCLFLAITKAFLCKKRLTI